MKKIDLVDIYDKTLKNGGHTVEVGGRYMVALKDYEKVVSLKDFTPTALYDYYMDTMPNNLDGLTFGTWLHGNNVYLDTSKAYDNLQDAIEAGKQAKQLAIYDTVNNTEITL